VIFIDLRDRAGVVQTVFDRIKQALPPPSQWFEFVLRVQGRYGDRPAQIASAHRKWKWWPTASGFCAPKPCRSS
jgi:aspartyl-tRNA synthetase